MLTRNSPPIKKLMNNPPIKRLFLKYVMKIIWTNMNIIFKNEDIIFEISRKPEEMFMHSNSIAKFIPVRKSTPIPENHKNFISSSTHLSFNCRRTTSYERPNTMPVRRTTVARVPVTINDTKSSQIESVFKKSSATGEDKYIMVISKIAKPQANETVDDVLPSDVSASVRFPNLSGPSNTKLMTYDILLLILSVIAKTRQNFKFVEIWICLDYEDKIYYYCYICIFKCVTKIVHLL